MQIERSNVVLPLPLFPTNVTISPDFITKSSPLKIYLEPNDLKKEFSLIIY